MSLVTFGVRKPVVANLVMWVILAGGLVFGLSLRREFFPEIEPDQVIIAAPYPGAAPDEVEDSLVIKIEDQLADVRGVKEMRSTALEGGASILIEFEPDVRIEEAVAEVKREIDALQDLPEQSERITVQELEPNLPVVNMTLYGDADERTMKRSIFQMRDDLRSLPRMGDVTVAGVRPDEILVETRPEALIEHGLSLPEVAARVRAAMLELPGGAVRAPSSNVSVRTVAAQERAEEVRTIVVKAAPDGRPVRLGEIADVTEGFADVDIRTRLNGKPSVSLTAFAVGKQDAIEIAETVRAYLAGRLRQPLPMSAMDRLARTRSQAGAGSPLPTRLAAYDLGLSRPPPPGELVIHNDLSRFISQRLELLARNALWGAGLVFLVLLLLLSPRVAFWVTVGLVVSIFGTLVVMRLMDISLNLLTMFGLIVVIGLLVDDAIVVAENIASRHDAGEPPMHAAESGARQVAWPVVATVLTTICAFLPLRLIEGRMGDLLGALPLVVACALTVSLIESLLILPSHMAHSLEHTDVHRGDGPLRRLSTRFERWRTAAFQQFAIPLYARGLRACLHARYLTITVCVSLLILSFGMVAGGRPPFEFLVSADSETVIVEIQLPVGSPLGKTDEVVRRIEAAAVQQPEVLTAFALVGARSDIEDNTSVAQSHRGQMFIELQPIELRDRRAEEVIESIRDALGPVPEVETLRFEEIQGGPSGADLTLTVTGEDPRRIEAAADRVAGMLSSFDGVYSVADDADDGQRELRLELREGATELGFTTASVAEQVRGAVFGLEAHTFAGDREDVDVRVMFPEASRRSLAAIESMRVFTPDGRSVPLSEVVDVSEERSFASVHRLDRKRAITVTADVDRRFASPEDVFAAMLPDLRALQREMPGIEVLPRGRQKDLIDSMRTLPLGMLAAVGMIYVILCWLFSSYVQPMVILMAVPFAFVGAIWGHLLLGYELTFLSMVGAIALTGIVVNDSLILVTFYNAKRADGLDTFAALVAAGRGRFRAILLTTLTTVAGLSPLMLEQSFQARFLIPMAITISFGLIAATVVTLLALPCLLLIGKDLHKAAHYLWTGRPIDPGALARTHLPAPPGH